ncbi:hypothetical protein PR202_ga14821 [Eleusine coracana subsp. coracana]|uniref:Uncharacterized protein n=1 Tax=Eleusine coracana subsp. coracana TaxID=191504 RepID=A0AAV5CIK2_ELECO|nr:hypothetical protein PR202_ga14821 [Eleusine coracana subsp. coracana]
MEMLARAAAAAASCSTAHPALHLPRGRVPAPRRSRPHRPGFPSLRAAAAAAAIGVESASLVQQNSSSDAEVFACPVCYEPLIRKGPPGINLPAIYRSGFKCSKCNKSFSSKDIFLDLTVTSGTKEYTEQKPARTELFRSPFVSFLYERGWRQNFNRSGFPGLDEEVTFWVTLLLTLELYWTMSYSKPGP